jgi:hypothetical protein
MAGARLLKDAMIRMRELARKDEMSIEDIQSLGNNEKLLDGSGGWDWNRNNSFIRLSTQCALRNP